MASIMEPASSMSYILKEKNLYLAKKHFSGKVLPLLGREVEKLGGTVVSEEEEADIILVNPSHEFYKTFRKPDGPEPIVRPYHWLAWCSQEDRLVDPSDMDPENDPAEPFFTYPSKKEDYRPLRAYVSRNLARNKGESSKDANVNTGRDICRGGGLIVDKRVDADIIVIDDDAAFAKTAWEEKKKNNRYWQRLVNREWVDAHKNGRKAGFWEEDGEDGDDSFEEDEMDSFRPLPKKGRPLGQRRNEYTPQDDDFLCRYLAANFAHGSWKSRSTYKTLASQNHVYPQADSHPWQSWHERFKKNQGTFEPRVQRFIASNIDHTLKTSKERKVARRRDRALTAETEDDGQGESSTSARVTRTNRKRNLVEASDDEEQQPPIKRPTRAVSVTGPSEERNVPVPPPQPAVDAEPSRSTVNADANRDKVKGKARAPAPSRTPSQPSQNQRPPPPHRRPSPPPLIHIIASQSGSASPPAPAFQPQETERRHQEDLDDYGPDEPGMAAGLAGGSEFQPLPASEINKIVAAGVQELRQRQDESRRKPNDKEADVSVVSVDTDDVDDFLGEGKQDVTQEIPLKDIGNTEARRRSSSHAEGRAYPPRLSSPSKQHTTLDPELDSQLLPQSSSTKNLPSPPRNLRPATDLVRTRKSPRLEPSELVPLSTPSTLKTDVKVDPVENQRGEGLGRQSSVAPAEVSPGPEERDQRFETPRPKVSPSRRPRRSFLQEQLLASASKRRKTLDRMSGNNHGTPGSIDGDLDTVYAENAIPPRPARSVPTPVDVLSTPTTESAPPRPAVKPLTPQEYSEKALKGKELADNLRKEYREKITQLSESYGLSPAEVVGYVNKLNTTSRKDGMKGWTEIKRAFEVTFGH